MDEGGGEDELGGFSTGSHSHDNNQEALQNMMKMMMAMQGQGGANGGAVDQKMAMEWLSHTMSFLFRSLALQMSMFERSTNW